MKPKTHKTIAKRVKLTGAKKGGRHAVAAKLMRKAAGQDHFNARESGKVTRKKRRDLAVETQDQKNMRRLMPHT